jgi:hypothetical protein
LTGAAGLSEIEAVLRQIKLDMADALREALSEEVNEIRSDISVPVTKDAKGRKQRSRPYEPPRKETGELQRGVYRTEARILGDEVAADLVSERSGNAPEILEFGGVTTINGKTVRVLPRPYMASVHGVDRLEKIMNACIRKFQAKAGN